MFEEPFPAISLGAGWTFHGARERHRGRGEEEVIPVYKYIDGRMGNKSGERHWFGPFGIEAVRTRMAREFASFLAMRERAPNGLCEGGRTNEAI